MGLRMNRKAGFRKKKAMAKGLCLGWGMDNQFIHHRGRLGLRRWPEA